MIYQKINKIMFELCKLGKIKREEIIPTVSPLLAREKIIINPTDIADYRFGDNQASFIVSYEIIDSEEKDENGYQSMIVKLPAGGSDGEEKGRATYMAQTGAYRQLFQQIFAISILEPDEINNNSLKNEETNVENLHEFKEDDIQENVGKETKAINEMTEDDLEAEFANY